MSTHNNTSFICNICWSHPLQHKHNIQETSPAARIIRPCNTTRLLSSSSPSTLPRSIPSLKLMSNGPTGWPLAGHPLLVDDRSDQDFGEPQVPFTFRVCGPAALTYLPGRRAFNRSQLASFTNLSSCYQGAEVCFLPTKKVTWATFYLVIRYANRGS